MSTKDEFMTLAKRFIQLGGMLPPEGCDDDETRQIVLAEMALVKAQIDAILNGPKEQ